MPIKIEKGIALPQPHGRRKTADALFSAIKKMNIGDSITLPWTTKIRQRAINDGKYLGYRMKTQTLRDGRHIRVWRVA